MESCPGCRAVLPEEMLNRNRYSPCPSCETEVDVEVFPAFFQQRDPGASPEPAFEAGTSACFYHSENRAAVVCEGCGRFLCALCDIVVSARHLCPGCLEKGEDRGRVASFERHRLRYDNLALGLAIWPVALVFTWMFTLVTAPATLYVVFRYWNAPGSLATGRSRTRFVIAAGLACVQLAGWFILFFLEVPW